MEGHFDFKWLLVIVTSDTNGSQLGTGPHVAFCWLTQQPGEAPGAPQGSNPTGVSVSPGVGSAVLSKGNSGHGEWEGSGVSQKGKAPGKPFSPAECSALTAASPRQRAAGPSTCTGLQKVGLPVGRGGLTPTETNHSS